MIEVMIPHSPSAAAISVLRPYSASHAPKKRWTTSVVRSSFAPPHAARRRARDRANQVWRSAVALTLPTPLRGAGPFPLPAGERSEEHTSELQSLQRSSSDVFCL